MNNVGEVLANYNFMAVSNAQGHVWLFKLSFSTDSLVLIFKCLKTFWTQGLKGGDRSHPSTIGDLFMEGSLNPYADDPYAFG